jgi:multidrug efflux pump subunit AcrA (membrane-fusion protein)
MTSRAIAPQRHDIDAVSTTTPRRTRAWQNYVLGLACVGAIVVAYELVGPPSTSSSTEVRLATVARGVVQTSESASGNLAPVNEIDLNFKSSGILTELYVSAGQHVYAGKLLAEIDPTNASVALQEAEANLEAANAKLAETEADPEESSSSSSGGGQASAAAYGGTGASGVTGTSAPIGSTASTGSTGSTAAIGASSPQTAPTTKRKTTTTTTPSSTESPAVTQATEAANLASARAAVASDQLTVQTDQASLDGTKLYAPSAGTIASISGAVGDEVSAGSGSSSGSGSNSGGSSGSAAGAGTGAASTNSSSNSTGSSSSSGSGFIVLADLSSMQLTVSVSESDIGSIKVGQPATISVDALPSTEFAAKVTSISVLPTSSSGVVSYDVALRLTQTSKQLRPGMTATATIITAQADDAVNVESAAISSAGSGSTVTVDNDGKMVVTQVITGIVGTSSTQIVAGLHAGEEVAIPITTRIATSTSSTSSGTLGGTAGGFTGGGFAGGGFGGGGRFTRGG